MFRILFCVIALIVAFEIPLQILGKLFLWFMLWQDLGATYKATANYALEAMGRKPAYVLPLDSRLVLATTQTTFTVTPGITHGGQFDRTTGITLEFQGQIRNDTGRSLDSIAMQCRWRNDRNAEDRGAYVVIPLSPVRSGSTQRFRYTFKSRDDRGPQDLSEFIAAKRYHCYPVSYNQVT